MAALYLVSTHALAGKTAVGAALGLWLKGQGRKVGYLKPISDGGGGEGAVEGDALFMKRALNLSEPPEELVGVTLTPSVMQSVIAGQAADFGTLVRKAYDWVARDRDTVILEAAHQLEGGAAIGLPPAEIARLLGARVLLVHRYSNDLAVDDVLAASTALGSHLLGVVINAVTPSRLQYVKETLVPFLHSRHVQVLGLVPQERTLMGVSVGELADGLKGEIVTSPGRRDDLVQNLMIGTMSLESAYDYFRRKTDKAVIVTVDRPDLQIAALQTSTRCLVVCGHLPPNPVVIARAQEMEVPLIVVKRTTLATVEAAEEIFGQVRFHQERKLDTMRALLGENLDWEALRGSL